MMKKLIIVLQLSLMLISINMFSQTSEKNLIAKFLVEGGMAYGGDRTVNTDGGSILRAGTGIYLAVGGQLELSKVKCLMLRASIGYKYNQASFDNATVRLTRIPVTLMSFFKIKEDFRLGIGLTGENNIKFKGNNDLVPHYGLISYTRPRYELGYKWLSINYSSVYYFPGDDGIYRTKSIGLSASFVFPKG